MYNVHVLTLTCFTVHVCSEMHVQYIHVQQGITELHVHVHNIVH